MKDILILHGWGSRAKNWNQVKQLLENRGYGVLVPDLPGFGENPQPARPYSIDDYVTWVSDFCEKENLSQFLLLGHSFGGAIAIKLVNKYPEKVGKLVLVAPKLKRYKNWKYYVSLILAKIGKVVFSVPGVSLLQPLARKSLYYLIGTRDYYQLEVERALIMKETFKRVVKEDVTAYLSRIKIPTLIIWGKKDKITPLKSAYLAKKQIADSELEILENCRHVPNLEMPEALTEKILNFL